MRTAGSFLFALFIVWFTGCQTEVVPIQGTAQPRQQTIEAPEMTVPTASHEAAWVPEGYRVDIVVQGLIYPTSIDADEAGNLYVAEAGWIYGDSMAQPRIFKITPAGELSIIADKLHGPINDILWHQGQLLISHRGVISTWRDGDLRDLVTGLPSLGDHQNNQLAVRDGWVYFGQGTVTNSAVPGMDSFIMGWLKNHPRLHDTPGHDIELRDVEYISPNPFVGTIAGDPLMAITQPFAPFSVNKGARTIKGQTKANGTILRFPLENPGALEVYAWGLRNPYGVVWRQDRLFVAENGFDDRGSRPVANAPDTLWEITQGAWYGWPDYAAGVPVTDPRFFPPKKEQPEFVMAQHPPVPQPFLTRPPHVAVTKLAVSPGGAFGHEGNLFMAEFGDIAPMTGILAEKRGRDVVRIDPETGELQVFFRVREDALGPNPVTAHVETAGPRRPVDVVFDRQGQALYVVDLGGFTMLPTPAPTIHAFPGTGVIWRITPDGVEDLKPTGNLHITPRLHQQ